MANASKSKRLIEVCLVVLALAGLTSVILPTLSTAQERLQRIAQPASRELP